MTTHTRALTGSRLAGPRRVEAVRGELRPTTSHRTTYRIATLGAVIGTALLLLSCASAPPPEPDLPPRGDEAHGIVIIAHGVAARSDGWPLSVEREIRRRAADVSQWDFYRVEWHEASLRAVRAPRVGYELGRRVAVELLAAEERSGRSYEVVHLVGHSAGAHVVQGFLDTLAAAGHGPLERDGADPAAPGDGSPTGGSQRDRFIYATYLDPFVARSPVRLFWGVRRFGRNADVSLNYVTRDDRVPFTNSFLRLMPNVDLTDLVAELSATPEDDAHVFPLRYYRESSTSTGTPLGVSIAPAVVLAEVSADFARERYRDIADLLPGPGAVLVP